MRWASVVVFVDPGCFKLLLPSLEGEQAVSMINACS
jgi:hypothetical protein